MCFEYFLSQTGFWAQLVNLQARNFGFSFCQSGFYFVSGEWKLNTWHQAYRLPGAVVSPRSPRSPSGRDWKCMWYLCVCTSSISVSKPIIHLFLKPRVLASISSPAHTWDNHSPAFSGSRFSDVTVRSWILLPPAVPLTHPPCLSQPSSRSSLVPKLVLNHAPSDVGRARR